ncbi:hypothetical protein LS684_20210 [Cytobacillus spongiae]|jgi:putative hydrolase of the HAD superfamily|uniref:hypothetical protein n=1 Tax=Cytobacillus spongiae TaxID=2901381 RepID=UPI001F3F7697|nr:hypothetical protein [Cytobacillus spongiae]UII55914.1 hypothetical protein LS684_20210 [Cytobacillus spongiae]
MKTEPSIVLDIAGVLGTNFSPRFWIDLSERYDISYDELIHFKREIREELWIGNISESAFWCKVKEEFPMIEIQFAKSNLLTLIKPLPAIWKIPFWSTYADIHLLSNHRIEWVQHILAPVKGFINSITISAEAGCCKPQADIYLTVQSNINDKTRGLFVDDQEKNLKEAQYLGWNTLLADEKGDWISKVIKLL